MRKDVRWLSKHHLVLAIAGGLTVGLLLAGYFAWITQLPLAANLVSLKAEHSIDAPIIIALEQDVQKDFMASITPVIEGEWSVEPGVVGIRAITFTPKTTFAPSAHYTIKVTHLSRVTGQDLPNLLFSFDTEKAPEVKTTVPENNAVHVATDTKVQVILERSNHNLRALRPVLEPAVELTALPPEAEDTVFSWQPVAPLAQGQTYKVYLYDDKSVDPTIPLQTTQFTVVAEPKITSATNKDHFYSGESIDVVFDTPMRTDQPAIKCDCQGDGRWANNTHYTLTPQNIAPGKTYKYTVPEGLLSEHGGRVWADAHYEIKTPGHVVASISGLGRSARTDAHITVHFDQAVHRASAEARFSISPGVGGSFRWSNDTTMIFAPNGLAPQTDYRVSIAPGVQPVRFGLDSNTTFSMSFTTTAPVVRLNVPLYRQQHRSSCEAAALRMALAYRGVQDSDWNIVHRMGYNGQHKNQSNNTWDDPFEMYVGDVNGAQSAFQGYGAYAPPIAKAAQSYGRSASVHYGVSAQFIAEQIHAGNPVIIIGTASGSATVYTSWNGPNGVVHAWLGEHARTVVGVTGKASAPISFLIHDPLQSSPLTWSPARLMDDINAIPQLASQVVVVH